MTHKTATGPRRGLVALAWAATNLALGYCATFPLVSALSFAFYVRAQVWGILASADHDPEPGIALGFFVTVGVPLAVAAVVVNRTLSRRLGLRGWCAAAFSTVIAARLPAADWPERDLRIPAVDAVTGEVVIFTRDSGVTLVDAVTASCAVPGIWPPASIGDHRYVDGGVRSSANADLAAGADQILLITPTLPDVPAPSLGAICEPNSRH